ncbi:radical SAM family heme chaperone HemW [Romboutsia lituseburensis]|uniref:Heme chaperone HemW n=2 Tax=root TaxID=1 RepID=A0A1G9NZ60_9FIRM|nr:radical SAM family heme chaperone HemW [Romboutsia lituseburensis]CEH33169.1 Oxygen-independent coproporphyrinogen-III oxidase 1 [Romboutsia lituseburensis]SDL91690.1 oxygen-independent coproporphyrinogen-3 oxidase [Romboutsia lituseburensis DSM 797]
MLGLYIHIPFCISKCNYCDFNSYKLDLDLKKRYLDDLEIEMKLYNEDIKKNNIKNEISSVFIGGGTPSILNSNEIRKIFSTIKNNFNIKQDAEITMECNPGTLTKEKLITMKEVGVNRLSIGLQAVQDYHLKSIGRIHSYDEFVKNYKEAKEVGFNNINVDLMYALPNQNFEDWKESLQKIVNLNPSHVSAYSLILEEGTKLYDMYENNEFEVIDEDTDINMYNYTISYLKENGYNQYEISNYSKSHFECEHNILYWKCGHYIGVGPGASGYIENYRYNNVESLDEYHSKLSENKKPLSNLEKLSIEDKIQEKIFMGLRMNEGIKFEDFRNEFKIDFKEKYSKQITDLKNKKLINESITGISLTQKGREISNSVFVEFIN